MRNKIIDFLKRWGEIAGAVTVIGALFAAFISFFGGHLPPWLPYAEAAVLEAKQSQLSVSLALLQRDHLQDQIDQANRELAKDPNSPTLRRDIRNWQWQINVIDSQIMAAAPSAGPAPKS